MRKIRAIKKALRSIYLDSQVIIRLDNCLLNDVPIDEGLHFQLLVDASSVVENYSDQEHHSYVWKHSLILQEQRLL